MNAGFLKERIGIVIMNSIFLWLVFILVKASFCTICIQPDCLLGNHFLSGSIIIQIVTTGLGLGTLFLYSYMWHEIMMYA